MDFSRALSAGYGIIALVERGFMVLSRLSASVFVIALVLSSGARDKTKDSPGQKKILARGQKELLIGIIPELNMFPQRECYLVLRNYLSDRFG